MNSKKQELGKLMTQILEALDIGYGEDLLEEIRTFRRKWGEWNIAGKTATEVAEELELDEAEVFRWCEGVVRDARREHAGAVELVLRISGMSGQGFWTLLRERAGSGLRGGE